MQCGNLCLYESVWKFWNNCEKMQNFNFLVHFMAQKAEYRNPCQWHSVKVIIFTCYIGMLHSNIRVSGLNFKCIMIWYWKMVVDGTVQSWCMSPTYIIFVKLGFYDLRYHYMVSACHEIKNVRVSQNQFCSQSSNIWDLLLLYFIISQVKLTPVSKCWGLLALKYTSFVIYWPMYGQKHPWKRSNFQ